jgi:hypothetical protein
MKLPTGKHSGEENAGNSRKNPQATLRNSPSPVDIAVATGGGAFVFPVQTDQSVDSFPHPAETSSGPEWNSDETSSPRVTVTGLGAEIARRTRFVPTATSLISIESPIRIV